MLLRRAFLSLAVASFLLSAVSEAAMGGGRSRGSRGSRGPARSYDGGAQRQQQYNSPDRFQRSQQDARQAPQGGGFLRNLGAGLAGGFLGSMLFRSLGGGGYGGGGGGPSIFMLILLAIAAFMAFRWFKNRQRMASVGGTSPWATGGLRREPFPPSTNYDPTPIAVATTEDPGDVLQKFENNFDEKRFCEARVDEFFQMQAAFSRRDLVPVRDLITPELGKELEADVADLVRQGRVNRLENIAVRSSELTEAWEETGALYATVRIRASVLDYTVDDKTLAVISGDAKTPTQFEEFWTFRRDVGFTAKDSVWRLSAMERAAS